MNINTEMYEHIAHTIKWADEEAHKQLDEEHYIHVGFALTQVKHELVALFTEYDTKFLPARFWADASLPPSK